jgi:guanine nucleotide-binding protein subunit alpha
LVLFKEISNLSVFKKSTLVLFLNKIDLLKWKLKNGVSPIRRAFKDYTADPEAPDAFQTAQNYFAEKFKRLYKDKHKELYIHFTNATDTNFLAVTMESVRHMILQHNMTDIIL